MARPAALLPLSAVGAGPRRTGWRDSRIGARDRAPAADDRGRAPARRRRRPDRAGPTAGTPDARAGARRPHLTARSTPANLSGMADPKKPRPAFAPWDRRELPG